jgi:DsbC/DsbD-like thiol-disulfide interchange protein
MNKVLRFAIFFILFVLALSAAELRAQNISGSITGRAVSKGSTARGVITMSIPSGLHVNSSRPSSEYSIPTTVRISGSGVKVRSVNYPRGKDRKFDFSESSINVYEGTVRFPFTFSVPAGFRGNTVRLRAVVRYQACTNEVCYPPKNREITLTARVQ